MKKIFISGILSFFALWVFGGNPTSIQDQLNWFDQPVEVTLLEGEAPLKIQQFSGAHYDESTPTLPFYYKRFPVDGPGRIRVTISRAEYEGFSKDPSEDDQRLDRDIQFITNISKDRNQYYGNIKFIPIIKKGSQYERLTSFTLTLEYLPPASTPNLNRGGDPPYTSVLSDGAIYKIGVSSTGVYKLDYAFLSQELNMDLSGLDPRQLKLYGNGGGMLPEPVSGFRYNDLQENAIIVVGEEDGVFNEGDYILFYGEGSSKWIYNEAEGLFNFQMNVYDTRNYYFLKVSPGNGLRMSTQSSLSGAYTTNTFNDFARKEDELVNLLNEYDLAQGSGQQWFGDFYKNKRSYTYDFNFPNLDINSPVNLKIRFAARANTTTNFNVQVNGQAFVSPNLSSVPLANPNRDYADVEVLEREFNATSSNLPVIITYPEKGTNEGWLDYMQFNVRRQLAMSGNQMRFRDTETLLYPSTTFTLDNAGSDLQVWDVSNPIAPRLQETELIGSQLLFGTNTNELKEFIAFKPNGTFPSPQAVGPLANQNLHSIDDVDMIIIYPSELQAEAERLAAHRNTTEGLDISLVQEDLIFNEFSSGRQDATAIRDFCKMVYDRTPRFKYLLLFGDGSYDHRNIDGRGNNLVLTYQTFSSINPIYAFPSDDYYGLLDEGEGVLNNNDDLDLAIGRIPVRNLEQASQVVDKIINYDSNPDALGDWRNRIVFVGDDEDSGLHTRDADNIADDVSNRYPNLNVEKVYIDAYNQVPTPGGQRVPSATEALNNNLFKGTLAVTYLGHGGAKGWAQERILQIPDINGWTNFDQMPIFITATCSFSGYDDPGFTTAGELVLLNRRGGGIALFTTVRAVFASQNEKLTRAAADTLFQKVDGLGQPIGEVMRAAKNDTPSGSNTRKFTLLGDPSMRLAIPRYQVATTRINGVDVSSGQLDTIRALQNVTVEGEIRSNNGQLLENFNGTLYPTIFDKVVNYQTLGQDNTPVRTYRLQKSVLFKGRASVKQGKFSFSFVVPKDINYNFGNGKISYYAEDGQSLDATGQFSGLIIGGTNADALSDDQGPKVDVFMNSESFVFGGITSPDPTLLVKLEDDNGINVVGSSIGHDLTGVLDENTQSTILLNDFYEAALDDYTRGEVRYPLSELEEGRHVIRVRAWDVANNSAEGYTEFVVAPSGGIALKHVLNYPNPFINNTCFQFEHNMEGAEMDVQVDIYTVSGRLVKTIQQRIFSEGSRLSLGDCIQWDGTDDFGDQLARGVYLYKVRVQAADASLADLSGESEFERLVILK